MIDAIVPFIGLAAAVSFVLALRWMSAVPTARRGVLVGVAGMALAVIGALLRPEIIDYRFIGAALVFGTVIGVPMAMMPMTAVPQRTALSHSFGALAAALVGTAEFYLHAGSIDGGTMLALGLEVLLGSLTFTASLMAFGKLQELLPQRPITFRFQNYLNISLIVTAVVCVLLLAIQPQWTFLFPVIVILALSFGILFIIPIGGADMPTVISLLNSYAGLSAAAMGFVLGNTLLIVAGALDGSSGFILSMVMSKAMNRSFTNILFGAFGQVQAKAASTEARPYRSASPADAADILKTAGKVVIVPGYGMAVAQAQHVVHELYDLLMKENIDVKFAIHPVAGRMPGHMNVLLAEANIPYDRLIEMDEINGELPMTDVALVIGANDVTNPAARKDPNSPIFGMPIIDVDKAQTVMVIKRSMAPGFSGIDNDLYYMDNTLMIFGDAKSVVQQIVKAIGGK